MSSTEPTTSRFYPEGGDRLGAGDVVVVRGTWPATEALLADAGEA